MESFMAQAAVAFTIEHKTKIVQTFAEDLGQGILLEMALIPPGQFFMGSPPEELERQECEGPQHQVTISQPFFMGQYQVTQAQWAQVAKMPQVKQKLDAQPSHFKDNPLFPVEQVSWLDAEEFCLRLSVHTKRTYRLPSEAEWEYACRAGTTTPFHFGETITTELANYDGSVYGRGKKEKSPGKTTAVGTFPANSFGLYDMHGNVWEWCLDHFHDSYEGSPADGSAWVDTKAKKNANRILRGGSWIDNPRRCRSANRLRYSADYRLNLIGFRVVYSPARILP
jgi:formylglycine-generating enzyme required for sulfatase activity